jgi:hypothetical protein
MNWNSIDITPPDELVEVKNKKGYTAYAYPTYYPFKIQEGEGLEGNTLRTILEW